LVTPGSVTTTRLSKSISRMRLNLPKPNSTPSASGKAPPDSEVPEPRGTTLMPCSWQYFRTLEICSVVSGSTTTIGGCRYAIRPSDS
jgi:hypothetical protein